jgi:hypothetical protein
MTPINLITSKSHYSSTRIQLTESFFIEADTRRPKLRVNCFVEIMESMRFLEEDMVFEALPESTFLELKHLILTRLRAKEVIGSTGATVEKYLNS